MREPHRPPSFRRGAFTAVCLFAAATGYLAGSHGSVAPDRARSAPTPAERVGIALSQDDSRVGPDDWAALRSDLAVVRAAYPSPQREVFDLVVAVRGLERRGQPDWAGAEERCRALGWPRCDRAVLEALRKRSRP